VLQKGIIVFRIRPQAWFGHENGVFGRRKNSLNVEKRERERLKKKVLLAKK